MLLSLEGNITSNSNPHLHPQCSLLCSVLAHPHRLTGVRAGRAGGGASWSDAVLPGGELYHQILPKLTKFESLMLNLILKSLCI